MSWIKDNKFIVALGSGTLAGAALIYFLGSHGAAKYQEAKEKFDAAALKASESEKSPLYPTLANRDGKRKAIDEYRQSVAGIQSAFEAFRPKEFKNITPQEFTTKLLAANTEIREAFKEAGTTVPEAFFVGFEVYTKGTLAPGNTTGVLDYQLDSITRILMHLAKARPTELKNLHRPRLPEEEQQKYTPAENAVSRPYPLEISFVGSERAAREFLSSITKQASPYVVIRSLRITNEKKEPPRAADAQFDKSAPKPGPAVDPFAGAFALPADDAPGTDKPAATPPAPKTADSSRILSQVLGNEQIRVFLRLDLLEFLPAKKLP